MNPSIINKASQQILSWRLKSDVTSISSKPSVKVEGKSFRTRIHAIASSSGNESSPCAWRGDIPTQSSLPMLEDGTPDYTNIDSSPISKVLTATIRKLLVDEVGGVDPSPSPPSSFQGMLAAVRAVNDAEGTAEDVQVRAARVFGNILPALYIGWVPPIWKAALAPTLPQWVLNYSFVLVFTTLFPWLMGPMKGVDNVDVKVPEGVRKVLKFLPETISVPQSVKAERCRFVESTACASVCVNSCKVPSQTWLKNDFGMDLHIQPNYDDFSCQWKFNVVPPPLYEDEAVMVPCFSKCPSEVKGQKDAVRQKTRALRGFGMENGVDKYTGDTLEQIVARASVAALKEATLPEVTPNGSALSVETLELRMKETKSGGKCWSVDASREELFAKLAEANADKA